MTRNDIIRMAREAGALQIGFSKTIMQSEYSMFAHELERFAALVAAAEREAFAKIVDEFCYGNTKVLVEKAIRARNNSEAA